MRAEMNSFLTTSLLLLALSSTAAAHGIKSEKLLRSRLSIGPCILSKCPNGYFCEVGECVPDMTKMEEIGPCVNTLCPDTYKCHSDVCLRLIPKRRAGSEAIGPCVNEKCPEKHMCQKSDYQCYPQELNP